MNTGINSNHNNIIFLDIEVSVKTKKIYELGMIYKSLKHNTPAIKETTSFIKLCNTKYICGHNFIDFDLEILKDTTLYHAFKAHKIIDTLPLSLLLFNEKSIHALPKNYKTEDDFKNDPVEDCKITAQLLTKLEERFLTLETETQTIFYTLLRDEKYFSGFFSYMSEKHTFSYLESDVLYEEIWKLHQHVIVDEKYLIQVIKSNPMELAYILALLTPHIEIKSHPPKILHTYKDIVEIQKRLCFDVKKTNADLANFSKEVFGFGTFRPFPKLHTTIFGKQEIT